MSFTAGVTVFSAATVSFAGDVDAQQADGRITASRTTVWLTGAQQLATVVQQVGAQTVSQTGAQQGS